jgi:hypothetical protein
MPARRGEKKFSPNPALNLLGSKADSVEPKAKKAGLFIGSLAGA